MISAAVDRGGYIAIHNETGRIQATISSHRGLMGWTGSTVTVKCIGGAQVYNEFGAVIACIQCPD